LSYEVDLFGRLRQASDAARRDAQASEGLLQSARLLVQADVAQTYLALRSVDTERALVRSTVVAYRETLALTERRWRAGDVAELDVARARTEVAATESEALALDRRRAELEHALAVLVGEVASSFTVAPGAWSTALPTIPPACRATVLVRRPDVSAAQNSLLAAQTRVGVAKAAWFPERGADRHRRLRLDRPLRSLQVVFRAWASARSPRCRSSTAAGATPASSRPAPSSTSRSSATASRCSSPSRTSKTSSRRCSCSRSRPRHRSAR